MAAISKEGSGEWGRSGIHGKHLQLFMLPIGRTGNEESIPGIRRSGAHGHLDEVSVLECLNSEYD
jgi:hypothetical protein